MTRRSKLLIAGLTLAVVLVAIGTHLAVGKVRAEKRFSALLNEAAATTEHGLAGFDRSKNAVAEQLEALIERHGQNEPSDRRGSLPRALMVSKVARDGWEQAISQAAPPRVPPPPSELSETLDRLRPIASEVAAVLLAGDHGPSWQYRLADGFSAKAPPFLLLIQAHSVLTLAAAEALSLGDEDGAVPLLEAAWRLTSGLLERPEETSHFVAYGLVRDQLTLIRTLCTLPPEWADRLARLDPRDRALWAFRIMAFHLHEAAHAARLPMQDVGGSFREPFYRLAIDDLAHRLLAATAQASVVPRGAFDAAAFSRRQFDALPVWQWLGREHMPSFNVLERGDALAREAVEIATLEARPGL